MKDNEKLEKINLYLEQEKDIIGGAKAGYHDDIEVFDFLEFLRDEISFEKIAQKVMVPLTGLKVATYYGCFVLRPPEIAIDIPENPTILENLMEVLGADIVDNPNRTQCCGSYHTVDRKEIVRKLAYDNLLIPTINGADIIVTCCPLCAFNLDFRQREIKKIHKDFNQIPVVYYTQLMAIAFGLESETHGFDSNLHLIDPKPIIEAVLETKKVDQKIIH
jgi:heterodisulfide reductase subunit B